MEKIFEISSNISTPLGIGGLFAAILFYIFKQILTKDLLRQMTTTHSAEVIKLIIERLFLLALMAMIFGFSSYIMTKLFLKPQTSSSSVQVISSPDSPSIVEVQPKVLETLSDDQRYELITLAQNGCYFFVPNEGIIHTEMEFIDLAQQEFIEKIDDAESILLVTGYVETGHTDAYAGKLGIRRAELVKKRLVDRYGISRNRIYTKSVGMKHNQRWVREYFCGARVEKLNEKVDKSSSSPNLFLN